MQSEALHKNADRLFFVAFYAGFFCDLLCKKIALRSPLVQPRA